MANLKKSYEEIDGMVLIPREDYESMYNALFAIALLGVRNKNHATEVFDTLEYANKVARFGLGWNND